VERSPNIVPARPEHIGYLAAHMRAEDRREVWAAGHLTPAAALERSLAASERAWTGFEPGTATPLTMFGYSKPSLLSRVGGSWCLTTDAVERWPVVFAKYSRWYVLEMLKDVEVLVNYVDARCKGALAWHAWLGARFDPPAPFGPDGRLFQRYEIRMGEGGTPPWAWKQ
jgi:hypothetical protein